jgi:hypothetical protein
MIVLIMVLSWGASQAWAQPVQAYIQENIPEILRDIQSRDYNNALKQARFIQRGSEPYDAANKNYLRQWFDAVVLNGMTHLNLMDQVQSQRMLIEFSLSPQGTPVEEARRDLETLTIAKMKKFVAGNYHPAVRVNACLLLGNLNQSEPRGTPPPPPVPKPDMLPELVAIFKDPNQIDAVRAAALVGIARHVELRTRFPAMGQVPADQSTAIREALVKLINQVEPPAERTQAGHDWLRESAVKIVAQLGKTTADNAAVDALLEVLAEPQASLDLKCTTVESLGQMQLAGVSDVNQVVPSVAGVAAACCAEEMKLIREVIGDVAVGEAGGAGGVLGFGSGTDPGAEIADPATIPTRRRLADRVHRLRTGLASDNPKSAILELATTNQQADIIKQVTDILDETMLALTQTSTTLVDLRLEIDKQLSRLNTIAPQPVAAPGAPATETSPAAGTPDTTESPEGAPPAADAPGLPF